MANAAQDDEAHRDDGEPSGTDLAASERDDEQQPVGWARLGAILRHPPSAGSAWSAA